MTTSNAISSASIELVKGGREVLSPDDMPTIEEFVKMVNGIVLHSDDEIKAIRKANEYGIISACYDNDFGKVKTLIDIGVNVNTQSGFRHRTALHVATWGGFTQIAMLLINSGALLNIQDDRGRTVLHLAAKYGRYEIAKKLLYKASVNITDHKGNTPLHIASYRGRSNIVQLLIYHVKGVLLNAINNDGKTPLHLASAEGHSDIIWHLLYYGADVNMPDKMGCTALHEASKSGHTSLIPSLYTKLLNLNAQDNTGQTALHVASAFGNMETVQKLIQLGIDTTILTKSGKTALQFIELKEMADTIAHYIQHPLTNYHTFRIVKDHP